MKRFLLLSSILLLTASVLPAQTEVAVADKPQVEIAYQYVYEIKTHEGKIYRCHEIQPYNEATALMVTYKTISDYKGCRNEKIQIFIDLADIKYCHSIVKF